MISFQVAGKSERKSGKAAGGDGYQPVMMTFKVKTKRTKDKGRDYHCVVVQAFLGTQDDAITDEEAAAKYNEYKLEFRRQQLNEFFVSHRLVQIRVVKSKSLLGGKSLKV